MLLHKYRTANLTIFMQYMKHKMQITQERWVGNMEILSVCLCV